MTAEHNRSAPSDGLEPTKRGWKVIFTDEKRPFPKGLPATTRFKIDQIVPAEPVNPKLTIEKIRKRAQQEGIPFIVEGEALH